MKITRTVRILAAVVATICTLPLISTYPLAVAIAVGMCVWAACDRREPEQGDYGT